MDRLGKAEAGAGLSMSGLPIEILLQIWSLADVGGDDQLDLREYLLCCFLVFVFHFLRHPGPCVCVWV